MFALRAGSVARGRRAASFVRGATLACGAATVGALLLHGAACVLGAVQGTQPAPVGSGGLSIATQTTEQQPRVAASVLSADEWLNNIRSERFWSGRRNSSDSGSGRSQRMGGEGSRGRSERGERDEGSWGDGSYRTLCVRLCDGYFYPVSSSVSLDEFADDAARCERSCSSPARLYVYRNGSQQPEDMVDLKGQPYMRLTTAFLFRTAYDESCKCKPHPWEQEAVARHRMYAMAAEAGRSNRRAASELQLLQGQATLPQTTGEKASYRGAKRGQRAASRTEPRTIEGRPPIPADVAKGGAPAGQSGSSVRVVRLNADGSPVQPGATAATGGVRVLNGSGRSALGAR